MVNLLLILPSVLGVLALVLAIVQFWALYRQAAAPRQEKKEDDDLQDFSNKFDDDKDRGIKKCTE